MQTETPKTAAWARVLAGYWPPHSRNLRHGAWYPVLENDLEDRVRLMLYGEKVDVPRRILDVRPQRPAHFTIVHRVGHDPDPSRQAEDIGRRYLVCPKCARRTALWGRPTKRTCGTCGHLGEIAWWE